LSGAAQNHDFQNVAVPMERIMVVTVFQDQKSRWHWQDHQTIFDNSQASVGIPGNGCCVNKEGSCEGFECKPKAENASRNYQEHKTK
jgi:hypothetical protein